MDRELDSLEHIMALKNQGGLQRINRNPQHHEEPSYRILPQSENHASSFGAGGTISQVIDPDFRPPSSHVFGQMPETTNMNIMSSTLLDYGPPVTMPNYNMQNTGIQMMGSLHPPPPPPPQNHHLNPFLAGSRQPFITSSANEPFRPPYVNPTTPSNSSYNLNNPTPPTTSTTTIAQSMPTQGTSLRPPQLQQPPPPPPPPPNASANQPQLSFIPSTSRFTRPPSNTNTAPLNDGPLYSPQPKNPSPPLDQINITPNININLHPSSSNSNSNNTSSLSFNKKPNPNAQPNPTTSSNLNSNTNFNSNMNSNTNKFSSNNAQNDKHIGSDSLGRIPKKTVSVSDKYDNMTLLALLEKYRECEKRLVASKNRRQEIEKKLNNMQRNSHGKNIELDPAFRESKDEQRLCRGSITEIEAKMSKIAEKLSTKFNHKVAPKQGKAVIGSNSRPPPRRAKMSTASAAPPKGPSPRESPPNSTKNFAKYKMEMSESKLWCKLCDVHFDSLLKYCNHLHSRDHLKSIRRSEPPWRRKKDKIDIRKTYDILKSICARVSNEVDENFSLKNFNKIISPPGLDETTLKSINLERERGHFQKDDPIMHVKGYENLIPINGFFCQLCDRCYCDFDSIDQHVKSFEHNYRHAISVANDEISEKTFREMQDKSFKKQFPHNENETSDLATSTGSRERSAAAGDPSTSSRDNRSVSNPPVVQYKKSTSRIVDEHEAVIQKYPDSAQPERVASSKPKSEKTTTTTTASSSSTKRRFLLESDDSDDQATTSAVASKSTEVRQPEGAAKTVKSRMPDIVPIHDCRSKPSALKRLKKRPEEPVKKRPEEPVKKRPEEPVKKDPPVIIEENSDISDYETPPTSDKTQVFRGDPESSFPDLDLYVTGNVHVNVLKDKRLSQCCTVKMTRINLDDYKDILMDSATLWTRVNHLMAKKEGPALEQLGRQLREKPKTKPTYFTACGKTVPINVEDGERNYDSDETDVEEKPKVDLKLVDSAEEKSKKSHKNEEEEEDGTDDDQAEANANSKGKYSMNWLETFFCDK